ncbi:PepSY domain-containing protein [Undibacter mobilis]|uniref:Peptidase n=1 Tax=Undibacter mobilis TaxID=2292256 RepID=A0A371BDY6_9BRAD|nr:PepSY domain-containing protein [Undibacter mobilis]RDV05623.1 peptidase [Undibacter mobilis]
MRLRHHATVLTTAVIAAALLVAAPPAQGRDRDDRQREDIRRAVEAGEIRSLADIIAGVRSQLPGEIAGVEIERKHDRWLYEFRVIDARGRLFEVYIDARNGTIERVKEK